ncbi:Multidrug export protein MepA [Methanimicrococcus sp. At1]|uniref:Multidrug export protein MepA n=1 Tax=Methanimicrococcus hacksteinii TaxID=3028293 RepID=A0ABU3VQZ5_9EURY|nr:MATE family efflux transporter [Methanimicrococcus sp. At1]MDV0445833.1 Multidrug export protein MepA [Methanimicrococcus sp. At1]
MSDKHNLMGTESINKALARLAAPAIISLVIQTLYGLVDSAFVGRGLGDDGVVALAALAIAFPVFHLLICAGSGVAVGGSSYISRGFGSGNKELVKKGVGNMISMAIAVSIICTILGLVFLDPILMIFGATETTLPFAHDYMFWIILCCVFQIVTITINAIVMAEGNSVYSMCMYIFSSLTNVVLDYIFIFEFGWGVQGAAIATVISQMLNVLILIFYLYKVSKLNFSIRWISAKLSVYKEIGKIGISEFLREGALVFTLIVMVWNLNIYGTDSDVAVYGLINRIYGFAIIPMLGIVQGMIPLTGYNYGAKNYDRVRKILKTALIWATAITTFLMIVTYVFAGQIFTFFIPNDPELVKGAVIAYWIADICLPVVSLQMIGSAFMQALGKARASFILAIARQVVMLPIIMIIPYFLGLIGVWIAYPLPDFIVSAVAAWIIYKQLKALKVEEKMNEKYTAASV